ncbi:MAG: ribbon-helix-helix protein, CopG family [Sarcina sp.]
MVKAKGFSNVLGKIQEQIQEQNTDNLNNNENKALLDEPVYSPKISLKKIKKKHKKIATSIRLNEESLELLRELTIETGNNRNNIINDILEQLYDESSGKFIIDIEKRKHKQKNDTIPVTIREDIQQALKTNAELRNMNVGEYFCKLFLKAQDYIN